MSFKTYRYDQPFLLENGISLPSVEIAYHTYGELNAKRSNVIWICHALTASSDAADWWSGLVGEGKVFDTNKYFIVCANILGSCYGSSGPWSVDPVSGKKYYASFPQVTIRDMMQAHELLRRHLGIEKIFIGAGGSMGAYQLLEWSLHSSKLFSRLVLMNTSARESAWGIAIHTAQRLAIEADPTWKEPDERAGANGLRAARAIGMLTYRNYETFGDQQTDEDHQKTDQLKASSYIVYQGDKLVKRFNAQSYWILSKAMDSHNLVRGRIPKKLPKGIKVKWQAETAAVLNLIRPQTLVIGMSSDILCPSAEQRFLAKYIPKATLKIVDSTFGHDGFLIEWEKLTKAINNWLKK